ncbi:MAG TPA: tetratricopeptide repeat protein [Anaerolineae bacterium]|nr:tetratricopeptide repeat protein [Anaerolineae bacterium]
MPEPLTVLIAGAALGWVVETTLDAFKAHGLERQLNNYFNGILRNEVLENALSTALQRAARDVYRDWAKDQRTGPSWPLSAEARQAARCLDYLREQADRIIRLPEARVDEKTLRRLLTRPGHDPRAEVEAARRRADDALWTAVEPYTGRCPDSLRAAYRQRLLSRLAAWLRELVRQDERLRDTLFLDLLMALSSGGLYLAEGEIERLTAALQAGLETRLAALSAAEADLSRALQAQRDWQSALRRDLAELGERISREHEDIRLAVYGSQEALSRQLEQEIQALRRELRDQSQRRRLRQPQALTGPRPQPARTFFDRLRELAALRRCLDRRDLRLIIVSGRAGMGKTALLARLLDDLEPRLDPGAGEGWNGVACFSAGGGGLGLDDLYGRLAETLGGEAAEELDRFRQDKQATVEEKARFLLARLRQGRYLLLLDNLEDALDEEGQPRDEGLRAFLTAALETESGARLLIASRHPLRVRRGRAWLKELPLRAGLDEEDAVALLRDLDAGGEAGLRDADEATLRELARRCHGIPRALEYAYSALANDPTLTTPEELLAEEALWRREVVEALQAESFRRLTDPAARRLLEALAVYGRPVPAVALQAAVAPDFPALDVRATLARLVGRAYAAYDREQRTFSLHPLDAEYLYRRLGAEERRALHARAADYYAQLRLPAEDWREIADLEPVLAEIEQRLGAEQFEAAARLLGEVDFDYLLLWGHAARVKDLREQLRGRLEDRGLAAANLGRLGLAYHHLGDARRAIEFYQQALAIGREIGDRRSEGAWLGNLGLAYAALGGARRAIEYYEQALAIHREIGDRRGKGNDLGNLGNAYLSLGDARRAIEFYRQALVISREIGDRSGEGYCLGNLGNAYADLGDARRAIEYYEQAMATHREIGDRRGEGAWLGNLGIAYKNLGDARRAIEFYRQALAIRKEIGDRGGEGADLGNLGLAYAALGDARRAIEFYQQALDIAREIGDRRGEGTWLGNLGSAYLSLGDARRAVEFYEQALDIAREIGDRRNEAIHSWNLGLLYEESDPARAAALMEVRVIYEREIGHPDAEEDARRLAQVRGRLEG